jgi:hypothetical protein
MICLIIFSIRNNIVIKDFDTTHNACYAFLQISKHQQESHFVIFPQSTIKWKKHKLPFYSGGGVGGYGIKRHFQQYVPYYQNSSKIQ